MKQVIFKVGMASSITFGCLGIMTTSLAQIVRDNTLPVNSDVTPGCLVCKITGGTVRGVNLFHSFQEFSVPTGGEAFFDNALDIQNILTRVTGNSISNIDGLIRANGRANLFLINPNGIILGRNARLDIGGSFFASTANSFKFADGSEFSATNPQAPPLLTVNVTPGLQFGANSARGMIRNSGDLQVDFGESLTLIGSSVVNRGRLTARGGDISLVATNGNLTNSGDLDPGASDPGTVRGGNISLVATNGNLSNSGHLSSYSFSVGGERGDGGNIRLVTTNGNLTISGDLNSSSFSPSGTAGDGGAILLSARRGDIRGGSTKAALASFSISEEGDAGKGGNVTLEAQNTVTNLEILTLSSSSRSGTVRITGFGNLSVTDTDILTSKQVSVPQPFGNPITLNVGGEGRSGDVIVTSSGNLTFNNSSIESDTKGSDQAGNVTITSPGEVTFNDSQIIANTSSTGTAGNVTITANSLVLNQGELTAETGPTTSNQQNEGANITLTISESLLLQNESLISARATGNANGGNIRINTGVLTALPPEENNGSDIIASAKDGDGGNISINAQGIFRIEEREANRGNMTNDIDATSQSGSSGQVNIITFIDPSQGLNQLPSNFTDSTQEFDRTCTPQANNNANQFIITGRGGIPSSPDDILTADTVLDDLGTLATGEQDTETQTEGNAENSRNPIIEAQGWVKTPDGQIILVASASTPNGNRYNSIPCHPMATD
ncbi:MAG TPA: hypothetical protein DCY91_27360 [Cyanobacteria bacterium UBA11370]|nr:hypothetical protein [Cyanobacteria bacterium UBA11370]